MNVPNGAPPGGPGGDHPPAHVWKKFYDVWELSGLFHLPQVRAVERGEHSVADFRARHRGRWEAGAETDFARVQFDVTF